MASIMASFTIDTGRIAQALSNKGGPIWPRVLTILGITGVVFYAVGPIMFPDAPLRQPELLPVYTLMMGLGQLLKPGEDQKDETNDRDDSKSSKK